MRRRTSRVLQLPLRPHRPRGRHPAREEARSSDGRCPVRRCPVRHLKHRHPVRHRPARHRPVHRLKRRPAPPAVLLVQRMPMTASLRLPPVHPLAPRPSCRRPAVRWLCLRHPPSACSPASSNPCRYHATIAHRPAARLEFGARSPCAARAAHHSPHRPSRTDDRSSFEASSRARRRRPRHPICLRTLQRQQWKQ
jgi:hypothetical protein